MRIQTRKISRLQNRLQLLTKTLNNVANEHTAHSLSLRRQLPDMRKLRTAISSSKIAFAKASDSLSNRIQSASQKLTSKVQAAISNNLATISSEGTPTYVFLKCQHVINCIFFVNFSTRISFSLRYCSKCFAARQSSYDDNHVRGCIEQCRARLFFETERIQMSRRKWKRIQSHERNLVLLHLRRILFLKEIYYVLCAGRENSQNNANMEPVLGNIRLASPANGDTWDDAQRRFEQRDRLAYSSALHLSSEKGR